MPETLKHCADCGAPIAWYACYGPAHAPVCWDCWERRERERAEAKAVAELRAWAQSALMGDNTTPEAAR